MVYNRMSDTVLASLEQSVRILEIYYEEVQAIKRAGGMYFNGCADRARRMQKSFADVGINADILVAKPLDFVTLEHESGTLWYHHFVIYATGLIYDPNYRRKSPLDISVYPSHAFPEQNVCLWKPGNKEPVLQYKYAA